MTTYAAQHAATPWEWWWRVVQRGSASLGGYGLAETDSPEASMYAMAMG